MYLDSNKIKYVRQHGFDTCKYINKLQFDFYLPIYNTCIEFDGIQHYKSVRQFGGSKGFADCCNRDRAKNEWCLKNNVSLVRIKYDQISQIGEIIKNSLSIEN